MQGVRNFIVEGAVMLAIGVLLAMIGPFGSFAMGGLGVRIAYWVPMALLGYAIFRPMHALSLRLNETLALPRLASDLASVLIAAVPATFLVAVISGHPMREAIGADRFFALYLQVALLGAVIQGFFTLLDGRGKNAAPASAAEASTHAPRAPFLDRLPPAWADRLVGIEMEDHYLRAHGPEGRSHLILMRMADAERELAGADGARVHRSWWVMRRAIERVRREGRAMRLDLGGGLSAPVARDRVAALRALGWPL